MAAVRESDDGDNRACILEKGIAGTPIDFIALEKTPNSPAAVPKFWIETKCHFAEDSVCSDSPGGTTPRHDNGAIFVQTVSDYPLVEAIAQNVVKHPVLPDAQGAAPPKQ